jgi:hypothetical protein
MGVNIDLREENGCVRGYWGSKLVSYCQDEREGAGRWAGPDGDFTITPNGALLDVAWNQTGPSSQRTYKTSIPVNAGSGKGWNELRKHPALLVVASNLAGVPH